MKVVAAAIKHLGALVPSCKSFDLVLFSLRTLHCRSEVANGKLAVLSHHQIRRFQIAMDDVIGMQQVESFQQLIRNIFDDILTHRINIPFHPCSQVIFPSFHHDACLKLRSEGGEDLDDVRMFWQFFEDFELSLHELARVHLLYGHCCRNRGRRGKIRGLVDSAKSAVGDALADLEALHLNYMIK